jgi:crotonobetainyl-CoA:carnitine CoA-transferase CaiB-like acyl-CoA transferase
MAGVMFDTGSEDEPPVRCGPPIIDRITALHATIGALAALHRRDELLRLRNELLAEVESIAPVVAEHAAASEALGRLDEPTMAALRSTRLLGYWTPRELGGLETDPHPGHHP